MLITSGSHALRKPTYGFAKEGQKSKVYRKTITVNWRCQCTKVILNMRSLIKVAEYLLFLVRSYESCKYSAHCRNK